MFEYEVLILDLNELFDTKNLKSFLNDGYKIERVDVGHVSACGGDTMRVHSKIVYILKREIKL
jgi:hypothetical protein